MNSSASNTWIHGHQRLTHMLVHYFSLLSFDNTTQSLPLGLIAFILFHQFLLISVSIFVYTMYVVNLPFLVFVLPFFLFSIITLARQHIPKYPPSFLSLFDHITHNRQEIRTYWLYALPAHFQSSTDINISLLPASASSITSCYQYWMSKWVCKTSSSTPMYTASIVLLDYHFTPQLLHFKSFSIIKNTLLFCIISLSLLLLLQISFVFFYVSYLSLVLFETVLSLQYSLFIISWNCNINVKNLSFTSNIVSNFSCFSVNTLNMYSFFCFSLSNFHF